jgi:DNA integrity scanning protein DisA with diadenylate cyclase activity
VCVSQSTGTVSVFKNGQMIADIQRTGGGGHVGI